MRFLQGRLFEPARRGARRQKNPPRLAGKRAGRAVLPALLAWPALAVPVMLAVLAVLLGAGADKARAQDQSHDQSQEKVMTQDECRNEFFVERTKDGTEVDPVGLAKCYTAAQKAENAALDASIAALKADTAEKLAEAARLKADTAEKLAEAARLDVDIAEGEKRLAKLNEELKTLIPDVERRRAAFLEKLNEYAKEQKRRQAAGLPLLP